MMGNLARADQNNLVYLLLLLCTAFSFGTGLYPVRSTFILSIKIKDCIKYMSTSIFKNIPKEILLTWPLW